MVGAKINKKSMRESLKMRVLEAGNGNPVFFYNTKRPLSFTIRHRSIHKMSFHPQ
jgi:hypothetical protein